MDLLICIVNYVLSGEILRTLILYNFVIFIHLGESWGMANDGEWRTGQYLVEGVKAIKCFHPRMLTPLMARVNTN